MRTKLRIVLGAVVALIALELAAIAIVGSGGDNGKPVDLYDSWAGTVFARAPTPTPTPTSSTAPTPTPKPVISDAWITAPEPDDEEDYAGRIFLLIDGSPTPIPTPHIHPPTSNPTHTPTSTPAVTPTPTPEPTATPTPAPATPGPIPTSTPTATPTPIPIPTPIPWLPCTIEPLGGACEEGGGRLSLIPVMFVNACPVLPERGTQGIVIFGEPVNQIRMEVRPNLGDTTATLACVMPVLGCGGVESRGSSMMRTMIFTFDEPCSEWAFNFFGGFHGAIVRLDFLAGRNQ